MNIRALEFAWGWICFFKVHIQACLLILSIWNVLKKNRPIKKSSRCSSSNTVTRNSNNKRKHTNSKKENNRNFLNIILWDRSSKTVTRVEMWNRQCLLNKWVERNTVPTTPVLTKPILCTKWPNFTMPFYYVKVPESKNELTYVHVGQKPPFTQKIRSLAQKQTILVF